MTPPGSALTLERAHLWTRTLDLATTTTEYIYVPKVPLVMCGGGGYGWKPGKYTTPTGGIQHTSTQSVSRSDLIHFVATQAGDVMVARCGKQLTDDDWRTFSLSAVTCNPCLGEPDTETVAPKGDPEGPTHLEDADGNYSLTACGLEVNDTMSVTHKLDDVTCLPCLDAETKRVDDEAEEEAKRIRAGAEDARRRAAELRKSRLIAPVPEGSVEWVLHEMGHWVSATPEERLLPDYGYGQEAAGVGKAREWQAWAFEEIVLAPWGPSRSFCPPPHRGGVAFNGREIPSEHLRHVERSLALLPGTVEQWRRIVAEWMTWEQSRDMPSWRRDN